jgi:hypothetical protein
MHTAKRSKPEEVEYNGLVYKKVLNRPYFIHREGASIRFLHRDMFMFENGLSSIPDGARVIITGEGTEYVNNPDLLVMSPKR